MRRFGLLLLLVAASPTLETTIDTSSIADSSTVTSDTPPDTSNSPDSTQITGITGPTTSASIVSESTGASSSPQTSTNQASTGIPGTTYPPTTPTLPPVNVSYVQFSPAECSNGFCSYSYVAPFNNPAFLGTESSIIATDQTYYDTSSEEVFNFTMQINSTIVPAQKQVDGLREQLEEAQENLNKMQEQLDETISNTNQAVGNLNNANYYIKTFINSTSPFYYCTLPPTPAPTTTTPTPPPTTTAGPCRSGDFNCMGNGDCEYSVSGQPYCTSCSGNMDGFQRCEYSTCGDNLIATFGLFRSPGSDGASGNLSEFSGRTCTWNYPTAYLFNTDSDSYNLSGLGQADTDARMTLIPITGEPDSGTYPISSLTNLRKVNGFLNNNYITSFQLQLIIPDKYQGDPSFFFWHFNETLPATQPTATA